MDALLSRVAGRNSRRDIASPKDDIWNSLTILVADHFHLAVKVKEFAG
jgi:hypothetical protein